MVHTHHEPPITWSYLSSSAFCYSVENYARYLDCSSMWTTSSLNSIWQIHRDQAPVDTFYSLEAVALDTSISAVLCLCSHVMLTGECWLLLPSTLNSRKHLRWHRDPASADLLVLVPGSLRIPTTLMLYLYMFDSFLHILLVCTTYRKLCESIRITRWATKSDVTDITTCFTRVAHGSFPGVETSWYLGWIIYLLFA